MKEKHADHAWNQNITRRQQQRHDLIQRLRLALVEAVKNGKPTTGIVTMLQDLGVDPAVTR